MNTNNNCTVSPIKTNIRQLQALAVRIAELAQRCEKLLASPLTRSVTEGLIAVGLCKQAREQVSAACQNLGFAVETLQYIGDSGSDPKSVERQLSEAAAGVVEIVQKMLNVPEASIVPSIEAFVNEMLVIAAVSTARAEAHIKEGERLLKA